jgi:hypothetical protein
MVLTGIKRKVFIFAGVCFETFDLDRHFGELSLYRLPSVRPGCKVDTVYFIEEVEGVHERRLNNGLMTNV